MIYTSPKLELLGTLAGLTASDYKCTPGLDAGWTYWDSLEEETSSGDPTHQIIGENQEILGQGIPPLGVSDCRPHTVFHQSDKDWGGSFFP